jgi:3-deoxy-7-phosphoheptulonate synthase
LIILLSLDAGPSSVVAALKALGLEVEVLHLGDRTGLYARDPKDELPAESISRIPGVEKVMSMTPRAPLAMATKVEGGAASGGRCVSIGPARFGGGFVSVMAGPCTIEDGATLKTIARLVADAGATVLRGGVFKVRTSPHSFQGGGLEALHELRAVSREVGLPFFTELTDPRQVEQAADLIDGIQIGARHMQNFPLLLEAGRTGKPILLKRHMAADVDEWLLAAEYVLTTGNEQVILCERGLKSGEHHVRYLLDVGVVPYLKQRIGLPVIVDPSHAAGDWRLVPALARAAIAAGADGLIVEVHPRPESTRSDALQALPPADFVQLMSDVRALAALDGRELAVAERARQATGSRIDSAVGR